MEEVFGKQFYFKLVQIFLMMNNLILFFDEDGGKTWNSFKTCYGTWITFHLNWYWSIQVKCNPRFVIQTFVIRQERKSYKKVHDVLLMMIQTSVSAKRLDIIFIIR